MPTRRRTTTQKGYDYRHQQERKRLTPLVNAGQCMCHATRCINPHGRWIQPGTKWDLGHTTDRTAWTGPEHLRCNRADGGRRARANDKARRTGTTIRRAPITRTQPASRSW